MYHKITIHEQYEFNFFFCNAIQFKPLVNTQMSKRHPQTRNYFFNYALSHFLILICQNEHKENVLRKHQSGIKVTTVLQLHYIVIKKNPQLIFEKEKK